MCTTAHPTKEQTEGKNEILEHRGNLNNKKNIVKKEATNVTEVIDLTEEKSGINVKESDFKKSFLSLKIPPGLNVIKIPQNKCDTENASLKADHEEHIEVLPKEGSAGDDATVANAEDIIRKIDWPEVFKNLCISVPDISLKYPTGRVD